MFGIQGSTRLRDGLGIITGVATFALLGMVADGLPMSPQSLDAIDAPEASVVVEASMDCVVDAESVDKIENRI